MSERGNFEAEEDESFIRVAAAATDRTTCMRVAWMIRESKMHSRWYTTTHKGEKIRVAA